MSKFSEQCKEMMLENGTNVYRLSNSSSLERTALQRMVTGKRLPGIDFVKQFCRELRISALDERNLLELYKMESIGESVYKNRKTISQLWGHLAELEKKKASTPPRKIFDCTYADYIDNASDTEYHISAILEKEFSSSAESAYVYTNFPADIDWFFHQLSLMHQKYPNNHVSVQHLIHFQMDSKRSSANLKVLSTILPFVLSDNQKYESFYYYSKMEQNDFMQLVFPYFVITSEYVLVISGDLRHSVLHSDAEARNMYQKEFLKVQALSKPLLTSYATQESALTHYLESFVSYDYKYMYALENQPCLHDIAKNKIQGKISLDFNLSPSLLAGLQIFSDKLSQSNFCSFFSKSGLKYFADSRTLRGQLGAFFSPFTTEECIAELSSLLDSDKNYTYLMLDDTFELPSYINLEIYENKAMNIIRIDENLNVCIITITESSICEAFLDFVSSLKESEHICSETEYRATLLSAIEQLQESLDSLNE